MTTFSTFLEEPLHHRFEQQAVLRPNQVAVRYGNDELSYQRLNQKANQVASLLLTWEVTCF